MNILKLDYVPNYYNKVDILQFLNKLNWFEIEYLDMIKQYSKSNVMYNIVFIHIKLWYKTPEALEKYNYFKNNSEKEFIEILGFDNDILTMRKYSNKEPLYNNSYDTLQNKVDSLELVINDLCNKLKIHGIKMLEQDHKLEYLKKNQDDIKLGIKRKRKVSFTC